MGYTKVGFDTELVYDAKNAGKGKDSLLYIVEGTSALKYCKQMSADINFGYIIMGGSFSNGLKRNEKLSETTL